MLQNTERAIKLLDHIYPYETHKIGVIYVGPGQVSPHITMNIWKFKTFMTERSGSVEECLTQS